MSFRAKLGLFILFTIIPLSIFSGWVITKLWDWFIVPLGAPQVSVPLAMGLSLIYTFFDGRRENFNKLSDDELLGKISEAYARPFIFLTMGWVITLFM